MSAFALTSSTLSDKLANVVLFRVLMVFFLLGASVQLSACRRVRTATRTERALEVTDDPQGSLTPVRRSPHIPTPSNRSDRAGTAAQAEFLQQVMHDEAVRAAGRNAAEHNDPLAMQASEGQTNLSVTSAPDLGGVLARGMVRANECATLVERVFSIQVSVEISEYGRVVRTHVSGAPANMEGCIRRVVDAVAFPEARGESLRQAHAAMELGQRENPPEPEPTLVLPMGARAASGTLPARGEPSSWTTSGIRPAAGALPAGATSVHDTAPPGYVQPSRMLMPPTQ